jgi:hypothetical protein
MSEKIALLKQQKGHVAIEYVIVTFIFIIFLFTPITDDSQSVVSLLMESIRDFDTNRSLLYSLP